MKYFRVILFIFISSSVFSHSGRTDSSGGHYNRSTGAYHYHGGGSKKSNNNYSKSSSYTTSTPKKSNYEIYKESQYKKFENKIKSINDIEGKSTLELFEEFYDFGTYVENQNKIIKILSIIVCFQVIILILIIKKLFEKNEK